MLVRDPRNGKTLLAKVLISYWLFVELVPLVGGTSTDRSYAKRTWTDVCNMVRDNPWLKRRLGPKWLRLTIGEEAMQTLDGAEYTFAANNRRAFRSTTLHRWIADELREHDSLACWDSASNAMNAVFDAQTIAITNQGDERAVVLDSLRDPAVEFIETGVGDPRLGLLEWSAPPGCEPDDPKAICQANPNAGRRLDLDALIATARRAKRAGGEELAGYRTEILCQRVHLLDPAVDPDLWDRAGTDTPLDLAQHRDKVALALDVSLDGSHATLVAAAVIDGKTHLEVAKAWDSTADLRRDLPGIVAKIKPRSIGWLPAGPAAVLAADMQTRRGTQPWPPRGVELVEIKSEIAAICMSLSEQVAARAIRHPKDPLLDQHLRNAQRLNRGDAWVFGRRGSGPVDGAYACAAAVHLARTLPPPKPALVVM